MPLRSKLLLLVAAALVPVGVLASVLALNNYRQVSIATDDALLYAAVRSVREERDTLIATRRMLKSLAVLPVVTEGDPDDCRKTLEAIAGTIDNAEMIATTGADGRILCSAGLLPRVKSVADMAWFHEAARDEHLQVFGLVPDLLPQQSAIVVSASYQRTDERYGGQAFVVFGVAWFKALLQNTDTSPSTRVAIVDTAGNVIATDARANGWVPKAAVIERMIANAPSSFHLREIGGVDYRIAVAPMIANAVFLVMEAPAPSPWTDAKWPLVVGIAYPLLAWVSVAAILWFAITWLVLRPTNRLRAVADAISSGDLSARPVDGSYGSPEMHNLQKALVHLVDSAQAREKDLASAVEEREVLLREIHHRVKNNLQIVTSLLSMQINRGGSEAERFRLKSLQNRIEALAMVHDSLYRGGSLRYVRMDLFLKELLPYLQRVHELPDRSIGLDVDMQPVEAVVQKAVPLALLVTEVVTNAYKHAWPGEIDGTLLVELKQLDPDTVRLVVADDGPEPQRALCPSDGLGTRLINGFARQLDADVSVDTRRGCRVTVTMPPLTAWEETPQA